MEQYELAEETVYESIRHCLKKFRPTYTFIRLIGSKGGDVKVNENLENKILDIQGTEKGLSIIIDGSEVFLYEYNAYWAKRFSLAYEREPDKKGVIPCLPTGIDPDDPSLPPVKTSFFRTANDDHLLEIYFEGKIPLKFHSWWKGINWKYWCVDKKK